MWKRHLGFSLSFILIALLNLGSVFIEREEPRMVLKPIVCLFLLIYLYSKTKLYGGFRKLVFTGLGFSLAADICWLFAARHTSILVSGLVAFFLTHLFYSLAFLRDFRNDPEASKKYGHAMLFCMGIFSLALYIWFRPYLNAFRFAGLISIFMMAVMAILAGYRYERVNALSFRLIFAGAILLVLSHSALLYDQFVSVNSYVEGFQLVTYMLGQYCITLGSIERLIKGRREA